MYEGSTERVQGDDLADRSGADARVSDYRRRGEVRFGRLRTARYVVVTVLAVGMTYLAATFGQVVHTGGSHGAEPADAIIVMGAAQYDGRPSPQLAARLDHVLTLWGEGVAPFVVVTGGKRPGDRFTEAEASASYLVERGVPETAIIEVGEGSSTLGSVAAAAPVMRDRSIERVALVTDPYHALRSRLIVEGEGFGVDVAATPTGVVGGWSQFRRQIDEAGGVAIGRIVGFDRLSDLTG